VIGIFDSGSGGLSVLRALAARFPRQGFVYLGDHAHAPYGDRPSREVVELSRLGALRLFELGASSSCSAATPRPRWRCARSSASAARTCAGAARLARAGPRDPRLHALRDRRASVRVALPASVRILSQPEVVADSLDDYLARHPAYADPGAPAGVRLLTTGDVAQASRAARTFWPGAPPFERAG
jgi:glutamate racemase